LKDCYIYAKTYYIRINNKIWYAVSPSRNYPAKVDTVIQSYPT